MDESNEDKNQIIVTVFDIQNKKKIFGGVDSYYITQEGDLYIGQYFQSRSRSENVAIYSRGQWRNIVVTRFE